MDPQKHTTAVDRIALAPGRVTRVRGATSPDGAITLMLGDIADAGSVAHRIGPDRWQQLVGDQRALLGQLVSSYGGEVARYECDGFVATFRSAHAGVHAAVQLQRSFAEMVSAVQDGSVALRLGLHSGFVIPNPEQPLGRNVVLAARIAGQASGGEILVSSSLKEYTQSDRRIRFEARGEYHFKGLIGEHSVYSIHWR